MEITRQKKFYLYRQTIRIGEYKGSHYDHQIRYILSEVPLKEESMYDVMEKKKISDYNEFFKRYWMPCFNIEDNKCAMEYVTHDGGWNGIYAMLPQLGQHQMCELIITVKYESAHVVGAENHLIEPLDKINYTAEHDFYAVLRSYDDLMLGYGDDEPFYEFDDDHIEWDVPDRSSAQLSMYKPICELFAYSNDSDGFGVPVPYKCIVKIEGNIHRTY